MGGIPPEHEKMTEGLEALWGEEKSQTESLSPCHQGILLPTPVSVPTCILVKARVRRTYDYWISLV